MNSTFYSRIRREDIPEEYRDLAGALPPQRTPDPEDPPRRKDIKTHVPPQKSADF